MQTAGWMLGGLVLVVIEGMAPGYFLIFPGFGCFAAALVSVLFPIALGGSITVFVVATLVLALIAAGPYRRMLQGRTRTNVNSADRLVGTLGRVEETIAHGSGKVRLGDTVWLAAGPDLAIGTAIRVVAIEGTRVQVDRAD